MASSITIILLIIFYFIIFLFSLSDLKQFIFHVHISRIDRVPVTIYIDSTTSSISLWYPIIIGIIFNIFILIFSMFNIIIFLRKEIFSKYLFISTLILFFFFTIRLLINIILTKIRNGYSTPTLVEKSFFSSSLSLEEELTTLILNYLIKFFGFISTFIFSYQIKQEQTMSIERRRETKLMSNFD